MSTVSNLTMKRIQRLRKFLRNNEGAALIEFAMVVPVLLYLLMGIIEFGIVFHLMSLSTYAANEAARVGKTGNSYAAGSRDAAIKQTVEQVLAPWMKNDQELVLSTQSYGSFGDLGAAGIPGAGNSGELVLYTITLNWPVLTPVLGAAFGRDGTVPITARVLVKSEAF